MDTSSFGWAALAALVMACTPAQAQVYKCKDAGGRTVMQQHPCPDGGGKLDVRPASGHAPAAPTGATGETVSDGQARLEKLKRDNEMAEAIRTRRPLVGMTREQLLKAMGTPKTVNANNYQGVQQEQNVFEREDGTWYVYTRSGLVESIQHRPGVVAQQSQKPPCPTQLELRNAEVSASGYKATDAQKAAYRQLLDASLKCR